MHIRRIDTHAHVHFEAYADDRGLVIGRALDAGTAMINVGTGERDSRAALELARAYDAGVYAIVGLHPTEIEAFDAAAYRPMLADPRVVGVGECGLDYYHCDQSQAERQKAAFLGQIALANEFKKPLMLHIRTGSGAGDPNAYDEALDMLRTHAKVAGNSHFFAGTIEQARRFLDMGYTLSFTGVITFARQYAELVEYVPLDMMHAETDCPFVTPVPHRGERNEPSYVSHVYEKIAALKKLSVEEVERQLLANAGRMFGIVLP